LSGIFVANLHFYRGTPNKKLHFSWGMTKKAAPEKLQGRRKKCHKFIFFTFTALPDTTSESHKSLKLGCSFRSCWVCRCWSLHFLPRLSPILAHRDCLLNSKLIIGKSHHNSLLTAFTRQKIGLQRVNSTEIFRHYVKFMFAIRKKSGN